MKSDEQDKKAPSGHSGIRRRLLSGLMAIGGGVLVGSQNEARAADKGDTDTLRFPGDPPEHKIVYQLNHADEEYHNHILFSVGALLRQYGDNIHIVVSCFGPGIHLLAVFPQRPISKTNRERVRSLAQYGVEFHACGNTMKSLGWTMDDMLPFTKYVEAGAADLMELQEQGYAYVSW